MSKLKSIVSLLKGYARLHDNLTIYENNRVVVSSFNNPDDNTRVKLISGGGSGHEPAHTGYVGEGMLTTSVCGDLFSSPSVQNIVNAILVTGTPTASILLIVKNYTGDRLSFGIAIEIVKNRFKYKNIEMVIINDDISIDDEKVHQSVGRRGLAGTVFFHKIIGAMAAKQKPLNEIVQYVNRLLANNLICTIGFTFITNKPEGFRSVEIGKGIHGEPGVEFVESIENFDTIYQSLLNKFQKKIPKSTTVIMMVNNLGGTSQFTMNIFLNEISEKFSEYYKIIKIYSGLFLTSLNSEGISVTLINLNDSTDLANIVECLEYKTNVPCNIFELNSDSAEKNKSVIKTEIEVNQSTHQETNFVSKFENQQDQILFKNIIVRCARELIENTDLLDQIDAEYGDGDTGSTLANFARQIEIEIKNLVLDSFDNPKKTMMQLADIAQTTVGGTTGALYCLFFQGITSAINDGAVVDLNVWSAGIKIGVATIIKYAHAQKGDRTLLDPLLACSEALDKYTGIEDLNKLCQEVVEATKDIVPKSGRAAYTFSMNEKGRKSNFPDPGAKAIGILVNAIAAEMTK